MDPILASSLLSVANRVYDHLSDKAVNGASIVEDNLKDFNSFLNSKLVTDSPFPELMEIKSLADLDSLIAIKERMMEYSSNFQEVMATVSDKNTITFERKAATGQTLLSGNLDSVAVPDGNDWSPLNKLLGELQALYTIRQDQRCFPSKPIGESIRMGLDPSSALENWTWNRY